ncbi:MAG: PHP domain-containing protein [Clostridia bacterium]|nr:PHP domain-containing protein [Clostridia bacterium]
MTADLHCHTKLSDGSIGINELIILAKNKGIETIAITDHDCLAGTVRGKVIGERYGVKVIPGVELTALSKELGKEVHILCYQPENPDRLEGLCHSNSFLRKRASQYMIIKASKLHPITSDFVLKCATGSTNVFKQHLMHALMECGITTQIYGEIYHELFSPESERNIIVQPEYPDPKDVVKQVKDAGGIAVLAHPAHTGCTELVDDLIKEGLDGIEVWHPAHSESDIENLTAIAKDKGLLMTGGSDFHGMYSPTAVGLGGIEIPQQHLTALLGYKAKQKRLTKKSTAE